MSDYHAEKLFRSSEREKKGCFFHNTKGEGRRRAKRKKSESAKRKKEHEEANKKVRLLVLPETDYEKRTRGGWKRDRLKNRASSRQYRQTAKKGSKTKERGARGRQETK